MAGKKFSLETIFKAVDRLSGPVAKMQARLGVFGKTASRALKGANRAVDIGLKGIRRFSDELGIAGVASVAGLGFALHDAMTKGIEFEDSLIRAGAALETPVAKGTDAYKQLGDAARLVGRTTEHSAQAASGSLEVLATAGYTALQSIGALPKIADFATAGKLELAEASEVAAATLGAFNLKVADATQNSANMARVMDVLVRSSADSSASVGEMFEAIKMGGPAAAGAGSSIEDFAAAANVLADSGVKGSMAGTALRNVFVRLAKQTPAAAKAMKKYGISVAKSKDGSIDMAATVGRFNSAMKGLSLTQKVAALDTIFGSEAMTAFQSLMAAGPAKIDKFTDSLENAAGTAKTMADTARTATGARLQMAVNKLNDIKLTVFESLAPVILDVADAVSAWVTENDKLITSTTTKWLQEVRDNLPAIATWTVRIGKAAVVFLAVSAAVKVANLAIAAYEVATKGALAVTWAWAGAVKASRSAIVANTLATLRLQVTTVALRASTLASRAATIATTAATWLYNAALKAGRLGMTRFTVAEVASKGARLASRAATVAATAAQRAYAAVVTTSALAVKGLTVKEVAAKVAQLASRVATAAATAAQTAYAAVLATTSGALAAFRAAALASAPAIAAQVAALAPLLLTVGALTAAVLALAAAWNQINKLSQELAGSGGITGTIGKMWEMGTFDPFAAHDAAMNEKARADRDAREKPQIVSPQERAAREVAEANAQASVDGKITVEAAPGTKASVRAKPRSVPLELQPSGAF